MLARYQLPAVTPLPRASGTSSSTAHAIANQALPAVTAPAASGFACAGRSRAGSCAAVPAEHRLPQQDGQRDQPDLARGPPADGRREGEEGGGEDRSTGVTHPSQEQPRLGQRARRTGSGRLRRGHVRQYPPPSPEVARTLPQAHDLASVKPS